MAVYNIIVKVGREERKVWEARGSEQALRVARFYRSKGYATKVSVKKDLTKENEYSMMDIERRR